MDVHKGVVSRPIYCMHQIQQPHLQSPPPTQQLHSSQPPQQIPIIQQSQQPQLLNSAVTYSTLQQPVVATHHFPLPQLALHQVNGVNAIIASAQPQQGPDAQNDQQQQQNTHHQQQQQQTQAQQQQVNTVNLTPENVAQLISISPNEFTTAGAGNIITEKIAIYRHPLFPLLRILFEKCELATNSIETVSAATFDHEIKTFITQMAKENKPFFTEDAEVDGLMLKSLQVLRIHLLELEKVNELCKDFCTRYISCLKGKLNSENIMKTLDISSTPPVSPNTTKPEQSMEYIETTDTDTNLRLMNAITVTQTSPNEQLSRSASVSYIPTVVAAAEKSLSNATRSMSVDSVMDFCKSENESAPGTSSSVDLTSGFLSKKNKCGKRGVLPKSATNIMKAWLFQHLVHPYPTEDEKKELAQQCNLSNLQVNNWFINARRRILQPMLETSNCFLKNNKKPKQQRSAAHKDWTNTIGVYNAYRTEALQTHSLTSHQHLQPAPHQQVTQQSSQQTNSTQCQHTQSIQHQQPHVSFVTDKSVLLNLVDGQTQTHPVVLSKPIQFVQLNQVPMVPIQPTYLSMVSAMSPHVQEIITPSRQSIMESADTKPHPEHTSISRTT